MAGRRNIPCYDYYAFKQIKALFTPEECTEQDAWQKIAEDEAENIL